MTTAFAYDTVEYPSAALPQADPAHLLAVARMFGLDAAPLERCRYLEVGCGDGTHLLASAIALPDATFVGIDLSTVAIERGNRMVAELRLPNVSLYAADLTKWEPPAGGFDYTVAHGLYSWVPAPVRDGLLALFAKCLRPHGVAYVSYNAYPGCYTRRMLWEMMRLHTVNTTDPAAKMQGAIELIRFLQAGRPKKADAGLALLAPELKALLEERNPRVLYHDDLGAVNDPVYFHEFAAHAKRFGLRFVAEAEQYMMETRGFPPDVAGILNGLAAKDVLLKEQYLDYLFLRRFRQTLLSPDGMLPREDPDPSRIAPLFVSGNPKPETESVDLAPKVAVTFRAAREAVIRIDLPIAKAALAMLPAKWPGRIAFAELLRLSAEQLGREPTADDREALAAILTAAWMTGMIDLHGHAPRYLETISERPVASPLARLQLRTGEVASTLLHSTMRFEDTPSRLVVQLLDGTRTRDEIAREVLGAFPPDNRPDPAALKAGLDRNLDRLAKAALLVG
jgi:SAM-dependent methyltransferase